MSLLRLDQQSFRFKHVAFRLVPQCVGILVRRLATHDKSLSSDESQLGKAEPEEQFKSTFEVGR